VEGGGGEEGRGEGDRWKRLSRMFDERSGESRASVRAYSNEYSAGD